MTAGKCIEKAAWVLLQLMRCYYWLVCVMGQQRCLLIAPLTTDMFGSSAAAVCQSALCLLLHLTPRCPLSVFQGLCLRGERQKHASLKVPRVPMWYSRRSHRHESPRNLLQSGCHYRRCLCMNELICCCETSYRVLIWQITEERGRKVFTLLT